MQKFFYLICFLLFFTSIFSVAADEMLLANPHKEKLSSTYQPEDLEMFIDYGIKISEGTNILEQHGRKIIMYDLKQMIDFCEGETKMQIFIRSGYRSYDLQSVTRAKYGSEFSVKAGESEHQLGLAVDFETWKQKQKHFMLKTNPVYKCLNKNAYKFGFVQTYTAKNPHGINAEPWHWRYLGKKATRWLYENKSLQKPWLIFDPEVKFKVQKTYLELKRIEKLRAFAYKYKKQELKKRLQDRRLRIKRLREKTSDV